MSNSITKSIITSVFEPFAKDIGEQLAVPVKFVGFRYLDNRHEFSGVFAIPVSVSKTEWESFIDWFHLKPEHRIRGEHQWVLLGDFPHSQLDANRLAGMGINPQTHNLVSFAWLWDTEGVL